MSEIDLVPLSRPDKPGYLAARIGDRVGDLYVEHCVAGLGGRRASGHPSTAKEYASASAKEWIALTRNGNAAEPEPGSSGPTPGSDQRRPRDAAPFDGEWAR